MTWRALGKAAVIREARRRGHTGVGPLVLMTTDTPPPGSPPARAIAAAMGADDEGPVRDVIELGNPVDCQTARRPRPRPATRHQPGPRILSAADTPCETGTATGEPRPVGI